MKRTREKTKVERVRFAQMLDELKADGITQTDFARTIGATQSVASRVKNGSIVLSV